MARRAGGHPVANRLGRRVLERARAGGDGNDGGAHQPHAIDVELLPAHVLLAHVHHALEAKARTDGGGGHAVLPRPGLGDDPALPHAAGKQRLRQRVVDLVGTGVVEVLALQPDRGAHELREPRRVTERGRTSHVVFEQSRQLGVKRRIGHRRIQRLIEFVERRNQRLGDVAPTERAEPVIHRGPHCHVHRPPRAASAKARINA